MLRPVKNGLKMIYFELKIVKMSQLIEKKVRRPAGGGGAHGGAKITKYFF